MIRKHVIRMLNSAIQADALLTILYSVVLITLAFITFDINKINHNVASAFVFLVILIFINIRLFRFMGLHHAFQLKYRIQYWKLKQKSFFGIYIFLSVLMIRSAILYVELLNLTYFTCILYVVWQGYKNINPRVSSPIIDNSFQNNLMSIELIDKMKGTEFEVFLCKLFEGLGYFAVLTPYNDFGIDVITNKDKIKTGIQAKCYGEGFTVGVDAVNEVCGGAGYWKVQQKMVITNRYFSKKALITAESNNVKMINRDGLQLLIREYQEIMEQRSICRFFSFFYRSKA